MFNVDEKDDRDEVKIEHYHFSPTFKIKTKHIHQSTNLIKSIRATSES
jgi:hypothetical protein